MKLQMSLDFLSLDQAMTVAQQVAPYVDVFEAGTPLIKKVGLGAVEALRAAFPDKLIYADMKTMDTGELEAGVAFDAGADFATVLGVAGDATIRGAVAAARKHGKKVVCDMIGVHDKGARALAVERLGVDMIALHHGLDEQAEGQTSITEFALVRGAAKLPFLMEGGINQDTLVAVRETGASQVAVGHAIYGAADPIAVAKWMHANAR